MIIVTTSKMASTFMMFWCLFGIVIALVSSKSDNKENLKNYITDKSTNIRIPTPLFVSTENSYPTKHVIYDENCGFAVLNPISDPKYVLLSQLLMGRRKYDATVAWFVLGKMCARLIYLREFYNCSTNEPFGTCSMSSPGWWDRRYVSTSFISRDELQLVFAAPSRELDGLYTRVVVVNGDFTTADIMFNVKVACAFSKTGIEDDTLCKPFHFFANATLHNLTMIRSVTLRAHESHLKEWVARRGGNVPAVLLESTMYHASNLPRNFRDFYIKSPDDYKYNHLDGPSVMLITDRPSEDLDGRLVHQSDIFTTTSPIKQVRYEEHQSHTKQYPVNKIQAIIFLIGLGSFIGSIFVVLVVWIIRRYCTGARSGGTPPSPRRYVYTRL
ncbi:US6 membrane glycoprotein D [Meleagrid alphaherpesvirus 1]|uniref:US6 membrane glycoprotein D n=2 Tax=Meleagrid herpesvirus 1 TaxID=37108 RepID=Q9DPP3_MEHV1|nr:US6 membrane glycoprotein D [Meleagrid alphaherpesvirus 1]